MGDRVDGVDQRHSISTAAKGRARWMANIGDVGGEFYNHWQPGMLFAPAGDHFDVFRNLANSSAHAAFRHAVRAAEIQFHAVTFSVFNFLQNLFPWRFLARNHEGHDHGTVWPIAFYFFYFAQIDFEWSICDQLDVIKSKQTTIRTVDCAVTRAIDVDDWRAFFA